MQVEAVCFHPYKGPTHVPAVDALAGVAAYVYIVEASFFPM